MAEYLSNDQIDKELWDILYISVTYTDNPNKGVVTAHFVYRDDITDKFDIKDGKIRLTRYYPSNVITQINREIRKQHPDNQPKRIINQPTHITIKRPKHDTE